MNDSDSAIILEENSNSIVEIPRSKGEIRVVRSVSDAIQISRAAKKYASIPTTPSHISTALLTPACSSEDDNLPATLTKAKPERGNKLFIYEDQSNWCQAKNRILCT